MRNNINDSYAMLKTLITLLLLPIASLGFAQEKQGEFMRVHSERIKVNDSLCYQVRRGYRWKDTTAWEPFCGEFHNFYFEEGYPHTLYVKEYNPHADTIFVIKEISRSSTICYEEYMRKKLREKRMRLKEKERNDTIRAIPVNRRKK
ncbi:MAG: hypothetical protein IKN77_05380 [Paludibacteraceae bacterium]|nr:hypothetical protein [Paludibacteraceae bacterium]